MSEYAAAARYLSAGERTDLPFTVPTDVEEDETRIPHVRVNDVGDGDELELVVWAVSNHSGDLHAHRAVYDGYPAEGMHLMGWDFTPLDTEMYGQSGPILPPHIFTLAYIEDFLLSYDLALLRTIDERQGKRKYTRHPDDADPDIGPEGVTR